MGRIPKVDELAAGLPLPGPLAIEVSRNAIATARDDGSDAVAVAKRLADQISARRTKRVINASGVLLHTNLGRAPWHAAAVEAAAHSATRYSNLEFDTAAGSRSRRGQYAARLAAAITGAEAALVVNNNAAALSLALAAIGKGGNVAVSRGELIEIGGSFRLPEIMAAVGCRLLEVGTTNRTRPSDFEDNASSAAMLLKIHPANYRISGFTQEVSYAEMASIASRHGIPFVADVGSGLIDARVPWLPAAPPAWLSEEAAVYQTLEAGADVVLFSGDKLLGGPQAGIAVGSAPMIAAMSSHPLARAFRCDAPTLAAIEATLEKYADGSAAELPFWRMALLTADELTDRSTAVIKDADVDGTVVSGMSVPGAGSVPSKGIPGPVISIAGQAGSWARLLADDPPVLARREDADLIIDLRAVAPSDDEAVAAALKAACR